MNLNSPAERDGPSAPSDLDRLALDSTLVHLVGQGRAYLLQLEDALAEVQRVPDERTAGLCEALGLTLDPARPGSLRRVEREATALLHVLQQVRDVLRR